MRVLSVALMLATILAAGAARAQYCVEAREEGRVPVKGTVGYAAGFGAFERVSLAYGASKMLQTKLLPALRQDTSEYAFAFDITSLLGAMRLPVCGENPTDPLGMGSMDLATGGVGFGMKVGPIALFYAGNSTYRAVRPDNGYNRWALGFGLPLMASFISPLAPIAQRYDGKAMVVSLDFIAGAQVGNDFVSGSVGYVASNGLYANITAPIAGLFGSAVFGSSFETIPVATVGFTDIDWLVGDLRKIIGSTALYGRRLQYSAGPIGNLKRRELGSAKTGGYQFSTVHFEQYSIGRVVDIAASMSLKPKKEFYDASLGIHSEDYAPEAYESVGVDASRGCATGGYRVSGGVVNLPVMYSHGSKGGLVPRIAGDVGLCGVFSVGLALNAADIVSIFPYARNTVSFKFKMGL